MGTKCFLIIWILQEMVRRVIYFCFLSNTFLGAAVKVKMTCNKGHQESWSNSKTVGKGNKSMAIVNLLIIVYTFLSGINFNQLQASVCKLCRKP